MADYLIPENLVQRAGWFAARQYSNTADPTIEEGGYIKIPVGGYRPKFTIKVEVFAVDSTGKYTATYAGAVDLTFKKDATTGVVNDYIKLYPGTTTATGLRFRVLVME